MKVVPVDGFPTDWKARREFLAECGYAIIDEAINGIQSLRKTATVFNGMEQPGWNLPKPDGLSPVGDPIYRNREPDECGEIEACGVAQGRCERTPHEAAHETETASAAGNPTWSHGR